MAKPVRRTYPSIRVFQNSFLERLTHVHPIVPLVLWLPIVVYLIVGAIQEGSLGWTTVLGFAVAGVSLWTLAEYLLHRFFFHYVPPGEWGRRLHFLIHGLHHEDPKDPTRLVMPPAGSILLGVALYALFRALLGPVRGDLFFGFFVVGYLIYDYTHYVIHHFSPRSRLGKWIKQSHMMHHFVSPDSRWGVSSPFWDYVFGTLDARPDRAHRNDPASAPSVPLKGPVAMP